MNDATLLEVPRPNGCSLRITREKVAGRDVVKLAHLTTTGVLVHGFVLELSELPDVAAALRRAS